MFVEPTGWPHLAYQNVTDGRLEYATFVASGGNRGFSSGSLQFEWQCDVIDDMEYSTGSNSISMAQDKFGLPMIAYMFGVDPGPATSGWRDPSPHSAVASPATAVPATPGSARRSTEASILRRRTRFQLPSCHGSAPHRVRRNQHLPVSRRARSQARSSDR